MPWRKRPRQSMSLIPFPELYAWTKCPLPWNPRQYFYYCDRTLPMNSCKLRDCKKEGAIKSTQNLSYANGFIWSWTIGWKVIDRDREGCRQTAAMYSFPCEIGRSGWSHGGEGRTLPRGMIGFLDTVKKLFLLQLLTREPPAMQN